MKRRKILIIVFVSTLLLFGATFFRSKDFLMKSGSYFGNINPSPTPTLFVLSETDYVVITETPIPTRTPTPTHTPTPTPTIKIPPGQISDLITKYSNQFSVSRDLLYKIGVCESGLNPSSVNGIYAGMYQFSSSSWITLRRAMNTPDDPSLRFNAEESIKTAAYKLSIGGVGAWPNCGK